MTKKKKYLFEIIYIFFVWSGIPLLYDWLIAKSYQLLPREIVNHLLIPERDILIYIVCFVFVITLFWVVNGCRDNPFLEKEKVLSSWKQTAMLTIMYAILVMISIVTSDYHFEAEYIISIIVTNLLFIAFTEEFSFRRMLIPAMEHLFAKKTTVIVLSTLIFVTTHIINYILNFESIDDINQTILIIKIMYLLVIGVLLAIIYFRYRSIFLCVLIHCGQNVLAQFVYIDEIKGLALYFSGLIVTLVVVGIGKKNEAKNEKII